MCRRIPSVLPLVFCAVFLSASGCSSTPRDSARSDELAVARSRLEAEPDETNFIWYGRRLAYVGRYREAIDVYTRGLREFPRSYRLHRHRGHRYLTLRRFEEALADFSVAARLAEGVPDEVEPDGLPNPQNVPRSTTHSNIYYHLGLVEYLMGDHDASRAAYERCLEFSKNDDMQCASRYWLYLNLMRLDRKAEADAVLRPVQRDMEIFENFGYHHLLLLFKGEMDPDEILVEGDDGVANATVAYGISMWNFFAGRETDAREAWRQITQDSAWAAFGHIAAEAELDRGEPSIPSRATPGDELSSPVGFRIDCLYSVPRERRGSWVCLTNDDKGRLIASDQYGALYRITLPPTGELAPIRVEELEVALGEAQGLLYAFESLYVVVNGSGEYESGLYRLRDGDGDDRFEHIEKLKSFEGNGEHGPHGIVLGPAGDALYVIAGNHTALPEVNSSHVPMLWGEDRLGPHLNDPNGHAVGVKAPGGWVCRTDPDGEVWELMAVGFRNAYDIAFDQDGELFTYDSDMEWDVGLPWYRPTRVLHVSPGAEFGWRTGTGKWPVSHTDSLPSSVDLGAASPTGVLFGTDTNFPEPWRNALFVADWAYGTLYAVHLQERGATYGGTAEPFLSGPALPLTDLATTGDGALYFTTGGRRSQSGLYRVCWTGEVEEASIRSAVIEAGEESPLHRGSEKLLFHRVQTLLRREGIDLWVPGLLQRLETGDRYERYRYRTMIERLPLDRWREEAQAEMGPWASIEASLALVRADPELSPRWLFERIATWPLETMSSEELLATVRVIELALVRLEGAGGVADELLRERLSGLLPAHEDRVNRELVRVLAFLQAPEVARLGVELLESAPSQESAIELALVLSQLKVGWTDELGARYLGWFVEDSAKIEGGHSAALYIAKIRELAHGSLGVALPTDEGEEQEPAPVLVLKHDWGVGELLLRWEEVKAEDRSLVRGKEIYEKATCATCHRIGADGGSQGPDLTGIASRFAKRDLLEAILEPSVTVSDQYRDIELWTKDGGVVIGRLEEEAEGEYVMWVGVLDERVTVPREDVEEQRQHALSRMPEGLLDPFDEGEVLDLLAYLVEGGGV